MPPGEHDPDQAHPVGPERVAAARAAGLADADAARLADLVGLLGDSVRARVLVALLHVDELCVGDLALALDASEDSISYALRVLRTAGLVRRRREGRMAYYRITDGATRPVLADALAALRRLSHTPPPRDA
jgi:DNA-binding transcriptional ArsR family regulator